MNKVRDVGRRDEAIERADRARRPPEEPMLYYLACAYARGGENERAIRALADSVDAGWAHAEWLRHDPDWSDHRDTPAFREIQARLERPRR